MTPEETRQLIDSLQDNMGILLKRCKFWRNMQFAILVMQVGTLVYETTLPATLGLWLPFFYCWMLAFFASFIPRQAMRQTLVAMMATRDHARNLHYKALTGVDRS